MMKTHMVMLSPTHFEKSSSMEACRYATKSNPQPLAMLRTPQLFSLTTASPPCHAFYAKMKLHAVCKKTLRIYRSCCSCQRNVRC